jgi:glycosyltransferase involved in cell wall biosynthesis
MTPLRLSMVWPHFAARVGIPGAMIGLCEHLRPGMDVDMWSPGAAPDVRHLPFLNLALPPRVFSGLCRLGLGRTLGERALRRRYLKALRPGTHAWIWPGMGVPFLEEVRRRGHRIVLERINTSVASARATLETVSRRHGLAPKHVLSEALQREEEAELLLADMVFACAPLVARSFERAGVPADRLFETTYGWDPERFVVRPTRDYATDTPTFLFVGSDSVRKGVPELLENWDKSGVKGRLRIVGAVEPWVQERFAKVVARPDVELLGYRRDLPQLYEQADVFLLMSHEEGSPLVTYLALAAGLPSLVSPAGAGGVVTDGVEGWIRDPYDSDAYVDALRRFASEEGLRTRLGLAARASAPRYTWSAVAARRAEQLTHFFSGVGQRPRT